MRGFRFPVAAGGGIVLAILIILLTPAAQMAKSDVGSADIWPMVWPEMENTSSMEAFSLPSSHGV